MKRFFPSRTGAWFFLILALLFLSLLREFRWKEEEYKGIIRSDGKGYYAYLSSIFIEGKFGNEKEELLYHVRDENGRLVNKYTYGTALLQSPFFLTAWLYASITGDADDAYSKPFQIAISLSALFYFLAGLYLLYRVLRKETDLPELLLLFLIAALALGTPLFYYVIYYGSFSHIYSFFLINLFIALTIRYREHSDTKNFILLGIIAGLIFMTRPVNILLVLFVPLLFNNGKDFMDFIRNKLLPSKKLWKIIAAFIIPVLIQMILWHQQCGKWFYWSYRGEGFYFTDPEFFNFLFSYKKGFFVYSPLFFILLPLTLYALLIKQFRAIVFSLAFCLITYVFSSWYCWYYSDAFGMRPMMDFYGIFFLFAALGIMLIRSSVYRSLSLIWIGICIPVNLVFAYQHQQGIVHPNAMNGKKFWMTFLKTDSSLKNQFGGVQDGAPYAPFGLETLKEKQSDFKEEPAGFLNMEGQEFAATTEFLADSRLDANEKLWIRIRFKSKIEQADAGKQCLFVVHLLSSRDSTLYYQGIPIKEYPQEETGVWKENELTLLIANPLSQNDKVGLYFWNRDREKIMIDDLSVELLGPKSEN